MPLPIASNCVPSEVLTEYPCLACLSDTDLQRVYFVLWARNNGFELPNDRDLILAITACNACQTNAKQRLLIEITAMLSIDPHGLDDTIKQAKKLKGLSSKAAASAVAYLKCLFWRA